MEWKEVRLGDIVSIKSGLAYKGAFIGKGENILLGMGCVSFKDKFLFSGARPYEADCDDKYCVEPGDIVLATRQQSDNLPILAMPALIPSSLKAKKIIYGTNLYKVENHSEVTNDFLFWQLKTPDYIDYISSVKTGSVVRMVTKKNVEDYVFRCPPKEVRDRISKLLWGLDRKIELNNKINADLEEMAQAIFKNWLSECTDEVTIGELSLNITNYEKTNAEEVVLINSSDVTEGYFDHHNYSPNKNLKGHFKKRFQKGDILYSQVRPRNRHWAYCNFDANDYLASTQLMVIRNNPSLITSILLYQYIISDNVWKEFTLKTETRSGTFPQGNYEDLSQIRVPYNSDFEGISNQLETLYAKMFMLEKENSRLSTLRDTLLPRLMSGELEVPE